MAATGRRPATLGVMNCWCWAGALRKTPSDCAGVSWNAHGDKAWQGVLAIWSARALLELELADSVFLNAVLLNVLGFSLKGGISEEKSKIEYNHNVRGHPSFLIFV